MFVQSSSGARIIMSEADLDCNASINAHQESKIIGGGIPSLMFSRLAENQV